MYLIFVYIFFYIIVGFSAINTLEQKSSETPSMSEDIEKTFRVPRLSLSHYHHDETFTKVQ